MPVLSRERTSAFDRTALLRYGAASIPDGDLAYLRLPIGQIVANEAQHVSALAGLVGRPAIGHAFAPSLSIDAVSAALDGNES